jgi:poly(A) polymerase
MKFELPENLLKIFSLLQKNGHTAYLAGGAVRDLLLGRVPPDYDVATDAKPEATHTLLTDAGIKSVDASAKYGTILAVFGGDEVYEITTFRTEGAYSDGRRPDSVTFSSPEEDAKRRDFTINGIFYDPNEKKIIDYVGGQDDLNKKIVRFIDNADERITEDHLRILRYVRIKHILDFSGSTESDTAVKKSAELIRSVSGERIRDEINKAFTAPKPQDFIRALDEYNLLGILLPEMKTLQGVIQGKKYHSEGDCYVHTLLVMELLPDDATSTQVWTALMHDLGKKETQKIEGERVSFYGHERISCEHAERIMERLKFPKKEQDTILYAIKNHMHMHHLPELREAKQIRIVQHKDFPVLMELYKADLAGSVPDDPNIRENDYKKLAYVEDIYHREKDSKYPPFVTGDDLIALGMKPGKKFAEILEDVYQLQLEKQFNSKEQALDYISKKL